MARAEGAGKPFVLTKISETKAHEIPESLRRCSMSLA